MVPDGWNRTFQDESLPGFVIGGIGAEEVLRHAGELFGAVRGERLMALVGPPPLPLGREHRREVAVVRQLFRPANDTRLELVGVMADRPRRRS